MEDVLFATDDTTEEIVELIRETLNDYPDFKRSLPNTTRHRWTTEGLPLRVMQLISSSSGRTFLRSLTNAVEEADIDTDRRGYESLFRKEVVGQSAV
jgi:hypothetical protein